MLEKRLIIGVVSRHFRQSEKAKFDDLTKKITCSYFNGEHNRFNNTVQRKIIKNRPFSSEFSIFAASFLLILRPLFRKPRSYAIDESKQKPKPHFQIFYR